MLATCRNTPRLKERHVVPQNPDVPTCRDCSRRLAIIICLQPRPGDNVLASWMVMKYLELNLQFTECSHVLVPSLQLRTAVGILVVMPAAYDRLVLAVLGLDDVTATSWQGSSVGITET